MSLFGRRRHMRKTGAALVLTIGLGLTGCAGTTSVDSDPNDPLEAWNRQIFAMNKSFDHAVLKPTAQAYVAVVPEPARTGVHNFLTNLDSPATVANDLLQGEIGLAGEAVGRFGLNSTLGLGGFVDLATPAGIPFHSADFGQTLGVWGVGDNPYLMLPLLGPSNPRDLTGEAADFFADPLMYLGIRDYTYWSIGHESVVILDTRSRNIETIDELERSSVDEYASTRSLYRQYRRAHVRHGRTDVEELPQM